MPEVIGVKFRGAGKVYYFAPGDHTIRYHDHVIVETARGIEYGTVVLSPTEIAEDKVPQPLKMIMRMATEEDTARDEENRRKEKEAYRLCKEKIAEHNLDMKLIEAEYTFDNSKVLFYFTADGRIDFRGLVKDLAGIFRTRIELRQIGVRDETKLLGGIGSCGRPLCCHTWLNEFAPVSIKMAKDQNLSLNPTKISGTCGRLMCCLKNEAETYAYLNKGMPGRGDYVTTPDGRHGDVQSVNILRQTVKVVVEMENDEKELQEFDVKDITFIPKSKKPKKENQSSSKPQESRARDIRAEKFHDVVNEKLREASAEEEAPETDAEHRSRRRRKNRKGPEGAPQGETGRREEKAGSAAPSQERQAGRRERRDHHAKGGHKGAREEGRTEAPVKTAPEAAPKTGVDAASGEAQARKPRRRRKRAHPAGENGGAEAASRHPASDGVEGC